MIDNDYTQLKKKVEEHDKRINHLFQIILDLYGNKYVEKCIFNNIQSRKEESITLLSKMP